MSWLYTISTKPNLFGILRKEEGKIQGKKRTGCSWNSYYFVSKEGKSTYMKTPFYPAYEKVFDNRVLLEEEADYTALALLTQDYENRVARLEKSLVANKRILYALRTPK